MAIDVVGSHMAPEAFTGQNGGKNPSSTMGMKPGEQLPRSTFAKSILASDPVLDRAGDWQTRDVGKSAIAPSFGMKGASDGGKIPSVLDRGGAQRSALAGAMARHK